MSWFSTAQTLGCEAGVAGLENAIDNGLSTVFDRVTIGPNPAKGQPYIYETRIFGSKIKVELSEKEKAIDVMVTSFWKPLRSRTMDMIKLIYAGYFYSKYPDTTQM